MKKALCLFVGIISLVGFAGQCWTLQYEYYGTTCGHYHGGSTKNYYSHSTHNPGVQHAVGGLSGKYHCEGN